MLVSQHNIKVVPKIFRYNLFILEKSILYITVKREKMGFTSVQMDVVVLGMHWRIAGTTTPRTAESVY